MTVDDETMAGARAELDLGYPRSPASKAVMAFCFVATLAVAIGLTAAGLVFLLAEWNGLSRLASMHSVVLLAGLGTFAVAVRGGHLSARFYSSRLLANAHGVRLDKRGRRVYTWSQIARFETATHAKSGDAFGAMLLGDGTRIELHALLEEGEVGGGERAGHAVEVSDRVRTLNRLLEQASDLA